MSEQTRPSMDPPDEGRVPMAMEERVTWVYGIAVLVTSAAYVAVVIPRLLGHGPDGATWVVPMLWAIGLSIAGTVVGAVVAAGASTLIQMIRGQVVDVSSAPDERDREISRLGDRCAHGVLAAGMVGALVLAMIDASTFWIGNVLFLAGAGAAMVEATVRIRAYRRGF